MAEPIEHGLSATEQRPDGSHKLDKGAVVIGGRDRWPGDGRRLGPIPKMRMIETVVVTSTNQATSPKFCIFGAGAIGGTIAAQLAGTNATVSVVARGDTLATIRKDGLRLLIDGETLHTSVQATAAPTELGPQDYVIIAVKAPSLPEVASRIGPLLGPETAVVTAMNGIPWWFFTNAKGILAGKRLTAVDPDGIISRAIPASSVIGCVVYMSCTMEAPGIIRHGAGRRLIVGEPDNRPGGRVARLAEWLRRSGFDCVESTDIRRDIWFKLWNNLTTNPISLLTAATLDRIIADPLAHALCIRMMEEAGRIGEAIGIPATVPIEEMFDRARALGAIKTSMLQDAEHGKPVEIDALLTVTHDLGRMVGVPTPFIDGVLGLARLKATSLGLLDRGVITRRSHSAVAPAAFMPRPSLAPSIDGSGIGASCPLEGAPR